MTATATAPEVRNPLSPKVTFDQLVDVKGPIPVFLYRRGKRSEGFNAVIRRVHAPITTECTTRLVDFTGGERRIMTLSEWRVRLQPLSA